MRSSFLMLITTMSNTLKPQTQNWGKALHNLVEQTFSELIHFDSHQRVKLCLSEYGRETFYYKSLIVKQARPQKINDIHAQVKTVPQLHWQTLQVDKLESKCKPIKMSVSCWKTTISIEVLSELRFKSS